MTCSADQVIGTAASQIGGYYPGASPYGQWYASYTGAQNQGFETGPYCAMFVSWCAAQVNGLDIIPLHAWTVAGAEWFRTRGQWTSGRAGVRRGDIVYFDFNGGSSIHHVGIVESVGADGTFNTIEGNTSGIAGGSQRNGRAVCRKTRDGYVVGYGRPAYSGEQSQSGGEVTMRVIVGSTDPRIWVTDGITKRYILGPAHLDGLLAAAGQSSAQLIDQSSVDAIPEWAPPGQIDTAALTGAVQDALSGDLADQIVDTLAARLAQRP